MNKNQLRTFIIRKLRAIPSNEKQQIERHIITTLLATEIWKKSNVIGITLSLDIEWDTKSIIKRAWSQGKTVCIPKTYPDEHKIVFYKITSFEQVKKQYYGLEEPVPEKTVALTKDQIDLLIVPGLVFNKGGFRIGFGGGYFDRFLADFPNETVSLLSQLQLVDKIPVENFDIPVENLIVENEIMKCEYR